MKFYRYCFVFAACCALLACCVGCKKDSGSRAGLVPAAGVVMYQGQPVADAEIEMRPESDTQPNCVAVGRTDAQGKFTLMTDRPNDGALPGKYKTVVKKQAQTINGKPREEYEKELRESGNDVVFDKNKIKTEDLVPSKYSDPINTPLIVEIPAKGDKNITITLED